MRRKSCSVSPTYFLFFFPFASISIGWPTQAVTAAVAEVVELLTIAMKDVGAEQSRGLPWNFCSLAPFPLTLNCVYCATTVHLLSRATFLSIGGRPVARNNRTRTTRVDDSNDLSRRRFIQSVAAAAGILGLNLSSQAEAAQRPLRITAKTISKGNRPSPDHQEHHLSVFLII